MDKYKKKTVYETLDKFSPIYAPSDYIEMSEWENGDGVQIEIGIGNSIKNFSLAYDEIDAIGYLTKVLQYSFETESDSAKDN